MVGIFVDDNVITVPQPTVAESDIDWRNVEIEAAEPEAIGTAAREVPDVSAPEATGEMAVLPRVVEMKASVIATRFVANPLAIVVDMGCVGMAVIVEMFWSGMRRTHWSGAVSGNVSTTTDAAMVLREGCE